MNTSASIQHAFADMVRCTMQSFKKNLYHDMCSKNFSQTGLCAVSIETSDYAGLWGVVHFDLLDRYIMC